MRTLGRLVVNALSLLVVSYVIPGFMLEGLWATVVTAIVMGVVNTFIRPILQFIALPLTLLTFGIAAFLVNVVLLWFVARIVPGFEIANFTTAVISSIALSLTSWFLHKVVAD